MFYRFYIILMEYFFKYWILNILKIKYWIRCHIFSICCIFYILLMECCHMKYCIWLIISRRINKLVMVEKRQKKKNLRSPHSSGSPMAVSYTHLWLVVGLHSKERELKINARLFAMMCLEMRLYFNMTEKNTAEKIFPLIPYQTMTWTDAELTKAMLRLSSLHSEKDTGKTDRYVYVIISLDFNKFNQKWRFESTYPIFKNIDDLLGTPGLLVYSHKFFKKAFFYLSSHLRPPTVLRRTKNQPRRTTRNRSTYISIWNDLGGTRWGMWGIVFYGFTF